MSNGNGSRVGGYGWLIGGVLAGAAGGAVGGVLWARYQRASQDYTLGYADGVKAISRPDDASLEPDQRVYLISAAYADGWRAGRTAREPAYSSQKLASLWSEAKLAFNALQAADGKAERERQPRLAAK